MALEELMKPPLDDGQLRDLDRFLEQIDAVEREIKDLRSGKLDEVLHEPQKPGNSVAPASAAKKEAAPAAESSKASKSAPSQPASASSQPAKQIASDERASKAAKASDEGKRPFDYSKWDRIQVEDVDEEAMDPSAVAFMRDFERDAEERAARRRERERQAGELKEQGNASFAAGRYEEAAERYGEALRLAPDSAAIYTNRALARIRLREYEGAIVDCAEALRWDEGAVKAHVRRATALRALSRLDEALEDLRKARELAPGNEEVAQQTEAILAERELAAQERRVRGLREAGGPGAAPLEEADRLVAALVAACSSAPQRPAPPPAPPLKT
eukprot:tig00020610_g11976.t1